MLKPKYQRSRPSKWNCLRRGSVSVTETTEVKTDTDLTEWHKKTEKDQVVMWKKTLDPKPIEARPPSISSSTHSLDRPFLSPAPISHSLEVPSVESLDDLMHDPLIFVAISSYEPESDEVMSLHEGEKLELLEDPGTEEWWMVRKLFNNRQGWVPGQYLKDKRGEYDQLVDQQLAKQLEQLSHDDSKSMLFYCLYYNKYIHALEFKSLTVYECTLILY